MKWENLIKSLQVCTCRIFSVVNGRTLLPLQFYRAVSQLTHTGLAAGSSDPSLLRSSKVRLQDLEGKPASPFQGAAASWEVHLGFLEWGCFFLNYSFFPSVRGSVLERAQASYLF